MVEITTPKRVFYYKDKELEDPGPELSVETALEMLAINTPELLNVKISEPSLSEDGSTLTYTLTAALGQHN